MRTKDSDSIKKAPTTIEVDVSWLSQKDREKMIKQYNADSGWDFICSKKAQKFIKLCMTELRYLM